MYPLDAVHRRAASSPASTATLPGGGPVPASSILLLDADARRGRVHRGRPVRRRLHRDADRRCRRARSRQAADHQLVIIDVVAGADDRRRPLQRAPRRPRPWSAIPVLCISQTDDVEERIALPRGRRRRRHGQAVRRPRARGPRRGAAAAVPAVARPRAGHRRRTASTIARARRTVAVFSPKGGVGTTTIATNLAIAAAQRQTRQGRPRRPRRCSSAASPAPQPRAQADARRRRPRRDRAARAGVLRTYAIRHDVRAARPRRAGSPEGAELMTPEHVETVLKSSSRGTTSSSSTRARSSTSGR